MKLFKYASDGHVDAKSASTIHELLGIERKVSLPYDSLASLEKALKTMNIVDMQSLAMKMEVKPISDRPRLVRALTDQYVRLHKSYGCALKKVEDEAEATKKFDPKNFEK